jgi:gliding motility-associated-like protein
MVILSKDCMSGLYVPTAFTPNGDGKNDVFRPLLFGNVSQYRLTVYNRWGEVVYQTTEPQKGWDGKVAGIQQAPNVFIWTCTYQLEGEAVQNRKGSVTLIR